MSKHFKQVGLSSYENKEVTMKYVCIFTAVVFLSGGSGLLISPMFRPELAGYNFLGLISVLIGFWFTNIVFCREW